jgi:chorismate lyase/3-hydroxybenzoate synthase
MTSTLAAADYREPVVVQRAPAPPLWVTELAGLASVTPVHSHHQSLDVRLARGPAFARFAVSFDGVQSMDILTFQQTVAEAYGAIFAHLAVQPPLYPVRFWAFVPIIHADLGADLDRYMAFNAGRFAAYSAWCGGRDELSRAVATGSAVGVGGDRLELHCLASFEPGTPMENPRQVPAYRYSRRYGPLPPCFARATAIEGGTPVRRLLLVGGTASIRGEDSLHVGNLVEQTRETLRNLASLVRYASNPAEPAQMEEADLADWLGCFREVRVYRPRPDDTAEIMATLIPFLAGVRRIELLQAELCRPELLVELEGVADLGAPLSVGA